MFNKKCQGKRTAVQHHPKTNPTNLGLHQVDQEDLRMETCKDRVVMIGETVMTEIETMIEDIVVIETMIEATAEKGIIIEIGAMIETEGMTETDLVVITETILDQETGDKIVGEIEAIDQTMAEGITFKITDLEVETKGETTGTILEALGTLTEVKAETPDNPGAIPEIDIDH